MVGRMYKRSRETVADKYYQFNSTQRMFYKG
jgi:hypothetical protein